MQERPKLGMSPERHFEMKVELPTVEPKIVAGFQRKFPAGDNWVSKLRRKHGIADEASFEDIEPVALMLLEDVRTSLSAAELVLNRRVGAKEKMIAQMIYPSIPVKDKFGMLLMEYEVEKRMKEKGMTDFGTTERI